MTIALSANTPRISYTVNEGATQTSFPVPFVFFTQSTDLNVFVDNVARTFDASVSNTTKYTVSGGDGSTGTVTTSVTGATGGSTVIITRSIPLARTTDFPSGGAFEISKLNTELDTLLTMITDADDENSRALRLQDSDEAVSLTLPLKDSRKGTVLGFNATTGAAEAGPTIANVNSLSAITANINTVAGISSNVTTVAGISSNVSTVAGIASNVTTLANSDVVADMALLADSAVIADMALLANADVIADMALLATTDVIADMNTLATSDIVADLNTLATSDIVSDLNTLATSDIVSDINTLATSDIVSDLNTLATSAIVADLNILATSDNVTNMATLGASGVVSNIATVAGVASNVTTVANNISGVNSFAERYRVASTDPSSNNDEGDLVYNTTDNNLKFFNGSSFVSVGGAISNLVEDSTPQLGGNLDVNGNSIVSVSGGNIAITPDGSGKVIIDGLSHPTSDGSAGQFLKTDGGGNLSFDTVSGTTINNNADNRVITGSSSANTLEAEANLTFDGTNLTIPSGNSLHFGSANAKIQGTESDFIRFSTSAGGYRFAMEENGRLGIGFNLAPSAKLHVSGANNNVDSQIYLTAEAQQTFKLGANGANLFFTSDHSAPVMFFNRAGTGTAVGGTTMFSVDNNNIQIRTDNQGTTLNGTRGISKCWLTGNGNSQIDAHNTQGYVDHGTGQQTVQVNHNYANANYCISFGSKFSGTFAWLTLQNNPSAGAFRFTMGDRNGGVQEGSRMMAMTMGQSA